MAYNLIRRPGELVAPELDYILMDGSGSMKGRWWNMLASLDAFVDVLKDRNVGSHGIVNVFDDLHLDFVQRDGLIGEWPKFVNEPLLATWGGTPLYDAINFMGRDIAARKPTRCSVVIVTDGHESDSRHTTYAQAGAILNWLRAQGFQVTFIGADFNNSKQAALLGMNERNALGVQSTKLIEAGKALGEKRVRYHVTGDAMDFSDEERTNFGGYLAGPSNGQ